MNIAKYREILDDPAPEHSGPQTGAKVLLPTGQRPQVGVEAEATTDNAVVASG